RAGGDDPLLLILPADHLIRDADAFRRAVTAALPAAAGGKLVTFGVVAHKPETGYGYIRRGTGDGPAWPIERFVEKPNLETARRFIAAGDYYWNSGMFLFRASRYLEELQHHAPDIAECCRKAFATGRRDLDFLRVDLAVFAACRSDS